MMILHPVYNGDDGKYVSNDSACSFWRKADILPVTSNADIKNNVGSATLTNIKNVISDDLCNELCSLMAQVKVNAHPSTETSILPAVFHSSLAVDPKRLPKDM